MKPWQGVRNLRPAGPIFYGAIGALLVLLAGFPWLFPHGIRTSGPVSQQGLLAVTNGDWARAGFRSRALLAENARLRPQGRQRGDMEASGASQRSRGRAPSPAAH
jgi:hypothetical protein